MSSTRLSQDYINWTLTLNATQVGEEIHKLEKENKELQAQVSMSRKAMAQLEAQGKKGSAEWKNLRDSVRQYNLTISENKDKISQLTQCMNLGEMTANQLQRRLKHLQAEFRNTSRTQQPEKWKELNQQVNACKEALAEASKPAQTLWEKFKNLTSVQEILKGGLWSIGEKIVEAVTGAFKKATTTIMDFESANARLASILGTNIDGISSLTEQAKLLGRTTTATASEVTSLQTELAKLGFATDAIESMTPAVLKFSQAVDTDLGRASAFAGAALRIFGKDAADTEEVLASFAIATTKSSLDFSKLETALSTAGPVAAAFGMSIEDTTALLGQLANSGFDASSAATATRNILLNMADSSGDLAKALGKPVSNLDELVAGLKKLNSEGIDLAKALDLTDKSSVAAFQSFLAGTDALIELRDGITGCTEDFNVMAGTMADTAAAGWAGLESAIEGLVLKFFDFRDVLKGLFNGASEVVTWLGDMIDVFAPLGRIVMTVVGWFGMLLSELGKGIKSISDLVKGSTGFKVALNSLVVAVIAYRVASMKTVETLKGWASAIKSWIIATRTKIATTYADIQGTNLATKATHLFNAALKANPIGLVVGLLAALVAGIVSYTSALDKTEKKTEELDEATKRYNDNMADAGVKYEAQKDKIEKLLKIQNDETLAKEERIRAINELNRIIPHYNAQLDAETGKVKANTEALKDYLKQLKKKLELEANKDMYRNLIEEEAGDKRNRYTDWKTMRDSDAAKESDKFWDTIAKNGNESQKGMAKTMQNASSQFKNMSYEDWYDSLNTPASQKRKGFEKYLNETGVDLSESDSTSTTSTADNKKGGGGGSSGSHSPKKDPIKEATSAADKLHGDNMLSIEKLKADLADSDYVISKNQELIRYCEDLDTALTELRNKTAATDKDLIGKIDERLNKIAGDALKARSEIDGTRMKRAGDAHKSYMELLQQGVEEQSDIIEVALRKQEITEGQAEIMRLRNQKDLHADQLAELRRYYAEVEQADYMSEKDRKAALDSISGDIRKMQSQILTDTGNWTDKLRSMMDNPESLGSISRTYEMQCRNIEATYAAMLEMVEVGSDQAVALEAEKNRRLAALNYQYQEQQWALRENVGLTRADEYERQLNQLKSMHARALIDEKGYQKKKLELQINTAKQYYDYYGGLSSSMFTAIQNAEIAASDAKYDVLIQQAKNNGEDTAALEEEKENKKLEIQKKYADVDFAIKISQIIADTSVSIMKAFSQLGPIGGAVAAAMLTATGVAQVISAKAERDKIKNMEPGRTSGASSTEAATSRNRVLTGYSEGGYTGDGRRLEVAGVVHKGEYVVPMPIMKDPRVVDAVGLIESIRQQRMLSRSVQASSGSGFAQGGYTSQPAVDFSDFRATVAEMRDMLTNIRAYVVYQDIEKAQKQLDRARTPFTRNG